MRTKPSEVFGTYGTRPLDLHGDWYLISCHARLLGMELIAHCKDPADLRLPVGQDWRETLCAKLCISGPDRRNAKAALDKLVDAGFLSVKDGFACVSLVPLRIHSGSTSVPVRIQSGSTPDPKPDLSGEIIKLTTLSSKLVKQESERARPREVLDFRRPLPDPPPGLPPAEKPLAETIVLEHAREYGKRRAGERPPEDRTAAVKLAAWCEQNAPLRATSPLELAILIVAGLFASDKAAQKRWKLSWAAHDPAEYVPPPPGCKPVVAAAAKPAPAHEVWQDPPWMEKTTRSLYR